MKSSLLTAALSPCVAPASAAMRFNLMADRGVPGARDSLIASGLSLANPAPSGRPCDRHSLPGNVNAGASDVSRAPSAPLIAALCRAFEILLLASGLLLSRSCAMGRRFLRARAARAMAISVLALVAQDGSAAQEREEPGIRGTLADQILNELRAIHQLLERQPGSPTPIQPPPQTGKLTIEDGLSIGSSDAPVTIVEFTDYQCPFCRQFHSTTFAELRKKYIDTGLARFIIRDFPLSEMHPDAMRAAEAAHCAADQDQFLAMHDALFTDPDKLSENGLIEYAVSLKLDVAAFRSCLETGKHRNEIQKDMQDALSLPIRGTPSFLIGTSAGKEVTGILLGGAQPLSVFESILKGHI